MEAAKTKVIRICFSDLCLKLTVYLLALSDLTSHKVEYDNRLANEIRVWWTASKASMIEKAQTDLTEIIEGTTELSSQLLCGMF